MLTGDQTNVAFMNLDELQAEQVSLMLAVDGDKAGIQFLAPDLLDDRRARLPLQHQRGVCIVSLEKLD